jgi:hypothetical protein
LEGPDISMHIIGNVLTSHFQPAIKIQKKRMSGQIVLSVFSNAFFEQQQDLLKEII